VKSKTGFFKRTRFLGVGGALILGIWLATAIAAPAQTFKTLVSFDGTDGQWPFYDSFVQGRDGNIYGTTYTGGVNGAGTVFKITPEGKLSTLYSFCGQTNCADGASPYAGLVLATDGNFYGTTWSGGANSQGTVFKIISQGALTTLYSFCAQPNCIDGQNPWAPLVEGMDGSLYGTTSGGGANSQGTVFKITEAGTLTTLHNFAGATNDGASPYAGLVLATDGNFYGTSEAGGWSDGTVFKITSTGNLKLLYSFDWSDGAWPYAGLVLATDGNFYGTTWSGGANSQGTVFKMTPQGALTSLYSFCAQPSCLDGEFPAAGLVQASDGNFYGTTTYGGASGDGTVFTITSTGTLTTLHSFSGPYGDGFQAFPGLLQGTNGLFYGMTRGWGDPCVPGTTVCGTIYSLDMGLVPFVTFVRNVGRVGQVAEILGQGFTGTTSVSFNGTPATFTVKHDTYLVATVPAGATTGRVTVATPGGTLTSNVPFRVRP